MNINENKSIEDSTPTILEELACGMHQDLADVYKAQYQNLTKVLGQSHEETIGQLVDRFRRGHDVDHTLATRCIYEILWEVGGIQTLNTEVPRTIGPELQARLDKTAKVLGKMLAEDLREIEEEDYDDN